MPANRFFSQKLLPTHAPYHAFECKLLAVHDSIVHIRHLLEVGSFVIFINHWLLVGALQHVSEPKSGHLCRQLSFIAKFTTEICHIAGQSNVVADTLSWLVVMGFTNAHLVAG
jgi:RNase H-like domain found in reverse transcriptase